MSQADTDILGRMVRIDLQIPLGLHLQVDQSVFGKKDQHVVEKTDAGGDGRDTGAVEIEFETDLGFAGFAFTEGAAGGL
jgi:hypothetical protein